MPTVSIIIPAYNEEAFIATLLERIIEVPTHSIGFKMEVIVVDDGSTDATSTKIQNFSTVRLIRQKNQGKGAAVQRGVREATGDYILIQDADLEYNPSDYMQMLSILNNHSNAVVYGSRIKGVIRDHGWRWPFPGRKPGQSLGPWVMNRVLSLVTLTLYGIWVTDMLTGYKIYPRGFLNSIQVKTKGFETDHELSSKLFKKKYNLFEVPVSYLPRSKVEGKKIKASDGIKAIWCLIKFRFSN